MGADAAKEFEYTIDSAVKDVIMRQSGCQSHEDGYVMIDSGASVNVCSMWFAEAADEQSDSSVTPRRGWTNTPGKRRIWLRIGNHLKRHEFLVVDGTKIDPGCQLLVRKKSRNTPREATLLEACRKTRAVGQEKWCVLRQGADLSCIQGSNRSCDARQISVIFMCTS